ncbi:hypothetical protein K438DRAFT_1782507 [Mycena galopus ATCC 62051]|nr:hypothetical protein K438DRAFT_1782507 [Mycena galopus ATCC 62051]
MPVSLIAGFPLTIFKAKSSSTQASNVALYPPVTSVTLEHGVKGKWKGQRGIGRKANNTVLSRFLSPPLLLRAPSAYAKVAASWSRVVRICRSGRRKAENRLPLAASHPLDVARKEDIGPPTAALGTQERNFRVAAMGGSRWSLGERRRYASMDSLRAASSVEEGPSHNASKIRRHTEDGQVGRTQGSDVAGPTTQLMRFVRDLRRTGRAAEMVEKCRPEGPKPKRAHASTLKLEIRILVVYRVDHLDCIGLTMLPFPGPMIYDQHEARRSRTTGQENVSYHSNVVWRCLRVVYKGPSSAPTSGRLIVTASHVLEDRNVGSVHVPCVGCSGSQRSKLLSSSRRVVRLGIKETQKVRPPPSNRSAALDAAHKSSMIYGPPIDSGSGRADKTEAGARRNEVDAECSNIRNKFTKVAASWSPRACVALDAVVPRFLEEAIELPGAMKIVMKLKNGEVQPEAMVDGGGREQKRVNSEVRFEAAGRVTVSSPWEVGQAPEAPGGISHGTLKDFDDVVCGFALQMSSTGFVLVVLASHPRNQARSRLDAIALSKLVNPISCSASAVVDVVGLLLLYRSSLTALVNYPVMNRISTDRWFFFRCLGRPRPGSSNISSLKARLSFCSQSLDIASNCSQCLINLIALVNGQNRPRAGNPGLIFDFPTVQEPLAVHAQIQLIDSARETSPDTDIQSPEPDGLALYLSPSYQFLVVDEMAGLFQLSKYVDVVVRIFGDGPEHVYLEIEVAPSPSHKPTAPEVFRAVGINSLHAKVHPPTKSWSDLVFPSIEELDHYLYCLSYIRLSGSAIRHSPESLAVQPTFSLGRIKEHFVMLSDALYTKNVLFVQAPVHTLPIELLSLIFVFSCTSGGQRDLERPPLLLLPVPTDYAPRHPSSAISRWVWNAALASLPSSMSSLGPNSRRYASRFGSQSRAGYRHFESAFHYKPANSDVVVLPDLTSLRVSFSDTCDMQFLDHIALPALRDFHVAGNLDDNSHPELLSGFPTLRVLTLDVHLTDDALHKIICAHPNLEELSVFVGATCDVLGEILRAGLRLHKLTAITFIAGEESFLFAEKTAPLTIQLASTGSDLHFFGRLAFLDNLRAALAKEKAVRTSSVKCVDWAQVFGDDPFAAFPYCRILSVGVQRTLVSS